MRQPLSGRQDAPSLTSFCLSAREPVRNCRPCRGTVTISWGRQSSARIGHTTAMIPLHRSSEFNTETALTKYNLTPLPQKEGELQITRACCLYFTANRSYASPRVSRTVMNSHVCRAQGGPQLGTQRTHYTLACKVLSSTYPVLEAWCYQVLQEAQSRCRWATISTSSGRL
jgi:hypothetical protein